MVSIEHLRRVWHADRGRLLRRTPGPVPLGLAYVLLVETNPFPNLSLFYRTMLFEYPSVLSRFSFYNLGHMYNIIIFFFSFSQMYEFSGNRYDPLRINNDTFIDDLKLDNKAGKKSYH